MDPLEQMLADLQKRTEFRAARPGDVPEGRVWKASRYVDTVWSCLASDGCAFAGFGTPEQWERAAKEAAGRLVYRDDEMEAAGGLAYPTPGETREFGDPDKAALKDATQGACMDFVAVITTTKQDHDNDVMETDGADLDAAAPLLWQHIPLQPIGRLVKQVSKNAKRLTGHLSIIDSPLGRDAAQLVEFKALRISHGFKPLKFEPLPRKKGDEDLPPGWRVLKFKILEVSLVSVPSNDDAVITAFSRAKLHHPLVKRWAAGVWAAKPPVVVGGWDGKGADPDRTPLDVAAASRVLTGLRERPDKKPARGEAWLNLAKRTVSFSVAKDDPRPLLSDAVEQLKAVPGVKRVEILDEGHPPFGEDGWLLLLDSKGRKCGCGGHGDPPLGAQEFDAAAYGGKEFAPPAPLPDLYAWEEFAKLPDFPGLDGKSANEHRCRINPPEKYDKFRRQNKKTKEGKEFGLVFGHLKAKDAWELQAIAYPKDGWTEAEAKKACGTAEGKFTAAGSETQTGVTVKEGVGYAELLPFVGRVLAGVSGTRCGAGSEIRLEFAPPAAPTPEPEIKGKVSAGDLSRIDEGIEHCDAALSHEKMPKPAKAMVRAAKGLMDQVYQKHAKVADGKAASAGLRMGKKDMALLDEAQEHLAGARDHGDTPQAAKTHTGKAHACVKGVADRHRESAEDDEAEAGKTLEASAAAVLGHLLTGARLALPVAKQLRDTLDQSMQSEIDAALSGLFGAN